MERFLNRVRRRLRLVWAWATTAWIAPGITGAAIIVVSIGWLRPWGWPEPVAAGLVAAALALVLGAALLQRLPLKVVARAADRGLVTGDSFAAALQFRGANGPFNQRIERRADALAAGAEPAEAIPLRAYGRRWALTGALTVVLLVLGLAPNPQDSARADRAATEALLEATADQLDEEAEALAEDPASQATAEQLRALAEELRLTDDLAAAQELLDEAAEALEAARPDNFASQRAAAEGLDRSLAERPLTGSGGSAAEQLAAVAAGLDGLSADDGAALDELAERLQDLADTQTAGNPAVAGALADAVAALAAGDVSSARAALGEAALAQAAASGAVAAQLGADQAAGALSQAQASLAAATGQAADPGQGQGAGQGAGQGQGQGAGGSGGGAQGQVGGAAGGAGSGQGGAGSPGGTDQARIDTNNDQTIVDPLAINPGEATSLGGTPGGSSSEVIGRGDGPTTVGPARVPLSGIIGQYADRATTAADRQQLPPSQRRLVGDYFDLLSQ